MTLRIHNTLSGKIDELIPGGEKRESISDYPAVTIYSCGPTVYSYAHIGNFRTFVFNDFLRRYLKFRGFEVNHAMNITDVDDKTISGANKENISLKEYTDRYTEIFFENLKQLNIESVEHVPRATESIESMIEIIDKLHKKGLAYENEGSVYFSISKFDGYGKLSRLDKRETRTGIRYDTDEYEKDDVRDFALWKASKEGEVSWDTPYGKGRPGWHIECSAMIRKIFGKTIDIHTGGVDLIFPHHENEIAQSEAAYDEKFVRHWIHVEHLLVEGSKMSKSLGNFYTLKDILDRGYSPRSIRYLLMSAHYKKQLNFTFAGLKQADQALARIDNLIINLKYVKNENPDHEGLEKIIDDLYKNFINSVDDDLNISKGLGIFFEFIHTINTLLSENRLSKQNCARIIKVLEDLDKVFGFIFFPENGSGDIDTEKIEQLIKERSEAKKNRDFEKADMIRDRLLEKGILLEDTRHGTRWKKKR